MMYVIVDGSGKCTAMSTLSRAHRHLHFSCGSVSILSSVSPEALFRDAAEAHPFSFPPPFNRYVIPKDAIFSVDTQNTTSALDDIIKHIDEVQEAVAKKTCARVCCIHNHLQPEVQEEEEIEVEDEEDVDEEESEDEEEDVEEDAAEDGDDAVAEWDLEDDEVTKPCTA